MSRVRWGWVVVLVVMGLASGYGMADGSGVADESDGSRSGDNRPYRIFIPLWIEPENKLGVAGCPGDCGVIGASWCYSWVPNPGGSSECERVPMIWGRRDMGSTLSGSETWLMGFNEPDQAGQANLTPSEAAVLWRKIEARYPDRKLVAPAPSHQHIDWLPQFRAAYIGMYQSPPRLDALAMHCYWSADECIAIGEQFTMWAAEWGVAEIWVTEFAFVPAWNADAKGAAQLFVRWAEGERKVTRYAPFVSYTPSGVWWWPDPRPEANPSLLTAEGELTEIGRWYVKPLPWPW